MKYIYWIVTVLLALGGLTGCDVETEEGYTPVILEKNIALNDMDAVQIVGRANEAHLQVTLGNTPKDLYLVLSNAGTLNTTPDITINGKKVAVEPQPERRQVETSAPIRSSILPAPRRISDWHASRSTEQNGSSDTTNPKRQARALSRTAKGVGESESFYLETRSSDGTVRATLRKVVANVATQYGAKTLNVWVADDSYGNCGKTVCVQDDDIDALADNFLKAGNDNDIYDWVTNVYGEEWGADAQSHDGEVIGEKDVIDILLLDIDKDNKKDGGVLGYFYPKDAYKRSKVSGSNERIMFYIDAVMFANEDTSKIDWKKETFSTLAHEFQHMIHFYQKEIKKGIVDDTWINEMLSESTEDLVATKIGHTGPRGVDPDDGSAGSPGNTLGRYPLFNYYDDSSLTSWGNTMVDYSVVNAFGAFLLRNYGGAKVLHDILYGGEGHEEAIEEATGQSFGTLMAQWGAAVLLSDQIRSEWEPMTYNTGDFRETTYGSSAYRLGSINFYNYTLKGAYGNGANGPKIYTDKIWVQRAGANLYYRVGWDLDGTVPINITGLSRNTTITLITK